MDVRRKPWPPDLWDMVRDAGPDDNWAPMLTGALAQPLLPMYKHANKYWDHTYRELRVP